MPSRFDGQTVIVTGAASGIGRATSVLLASEGARVVATDLSGELLDALHREYPDNIDPIVGDLTDPGLADAAIARCAGRIDALVNVAGIMDAFLAVGEVDDVTWERVVAVNLTAPMRLMRAALPLMMEAGRGAIVNVASEAGIKGGCAGAAYTASKHGLVGLTRNTAFLYANTGVRVNAIAPGPVETGLRPDFRSAIAAERLPALLKASISRIAAPQELAQAIAWLASADASNVNGAILPVDGGWSAA